MCPPRNGRNEMNGPEIMEDRIWEETVIPWLMGQ